MSTMNELPIILLMWNNDDEDFTQRWVQKHHEFVLQRLQISTVVLALPVNLADVTLSVKLHFLYSNSHWQVSYVVESHDYQYENIYLRVFLCLSMPNCGIGNEAHKCVPRATMIEIYKTESDVRTAL